MTIQNPRLADNSDVPKKRTPARSAENAGDPADCTKGKIANLIHSEILSSVGSSEEEGQTFHELARYEATSEDMQMLEQCIDTVTESHLLEEDILHNIRFISFDSKYLYVFTRGEHSSTEKVRVVPVPSGSKTGFKIFKIEHGGSIGRNPKDYGYGKAWLLSDVVESTAVNATKFPNENVLHQPHLPQPKHILDTVCISPYGPYETIQNGHFNYLTDVVFHEAGHIEQRRLENWQEGEDPVDTFPSQEQRERFTATVQRTKLLPAWVMNAVLVKTNKRAISEMYAMLIDREGAKNYNPEKYAEENASFKTKFAHVQNGSVTSDNSAWLNTYLDSPHVTGRLLVRILEEQFPDFKERKQFVRAIRHRPLTGR